MSVVHICTTRPGVSNNCVNVQSNHTFPYGTKFEGAAIIEFIASNEIWVKIFKNGPSKICER